MTQTTPTGRAPSRLTTDAPADAPAVVRRSNGLANRLLRAGLPMGPNVLLTVRGRTSGRPRSFPVAILEADGRRYVIGAYGDVQWTRNLRAAGEAEIRLRGSEVHVVARELDEADRVRFFGVTLPAYVGRLPLVGRLFAKVFFPLAAPDIVGDPAIAAAHHPVFELTA